MTIIISKYSGTCLTCGEPYAAGQRIDWTKGVKGAHHARCTDEGKAEAAAIAQSRQTDIEDPADFNVPIGEGYSYLPYQRAGIAFALKRKGTLFGDEPGLGKTLEAIGVINGDTSVRSVLIICPKSLGLNWGIELRKFLARRATIILSIEGTRTLATGGELRITIINYDVVAKRIDSLLRDWDLVILDEAHYCKNAKAKRTDAVKKIVKRARRRLALTGTPIPNRPVELWPILQMVDPENWDPAGPKKKGGPIVGMGEGAGFMRYVFRFCDAHRSHFGKGWDFTGASRLDELQDKLRATCMVRRKKSDVLKELPPKIRQVIELPGGEDAVNEEAGAFATYTGMIEELQGEVELARAGSEDEYEAAVAKLQKSMAANFTEMSRIRAATAVAKLPQVIEHVRDALEDSPKIILFGHHHAVLEGLRDALAEFNPVMIYGPTKSDERQAAVERFQKDPTCRLFIGGIMAAGTGLTLTAASHVIFAELDWVPGVVTQSEDRAHRIGQRDSVLVQHLVLEGSIDARMARILVAKQDIADRALDRERQEEPVPSKLLSEPVTLTQAATAGEPSELDRWAKAMTAERAELVHRALRQLAGMCDHANALDGAGFSRIDVRVGHSLAQASKLTPKQAALGVRLVRKYRRQLGDLAERCMPEAS